MTLFSTEASFLSSNNLGIQNISNTNINQFLNSFYSGLIKHGLKKPNYSLIVSFLLLLNNNKINKNLLNKGAANSSYQKVFSILNKFTPRANLSSLGKRGNKDIFVIKPLSKESNGRKKFIEDFLKKSSSGVTYSSLPLQLFGVVRDTVKGKSMLSTNHQDLYKKLHQAKSFSKKFYKSKSSHINKKNVIKKNKLSYL